MGKGSTGSKEKGSVGWYSHRWEPVPRAKAQCGLEQCWHVSPVPWLHLCLVFLPGHWVPVHRAPPPPLGTCATPRWDRPGAVASPPWPPHLSYRTGSAPSRYGSPGCSRQPGCDGRELSLSDPHHGQGLGPRWILGSFACVRKHRGGFNPGTCDPPSSHLPRALGLGQEPWLQGLWLGWLGTQSRGHWGPPAALERPGEAAGPG